MAEENYEVSGTPKEIIDAKACVPHDTTLNALFGNKLSNRIWVHTTGQVTLVKQDGSTVLFGGLIAGRWHDMPPFKRVNDTDTDAITITVGTTF